MKNYLTFNGISSADYGAYIADVNQFDAPAKDVEVVTVPGMNGTLTIDNDRFENVQQTYQIYVRGELKSRLMGLRNMYAQTSGYCRLEDTLTPDEFYLARFVNAFEVPQSDRHRAAFSLIFDRKPQRFLKSGEFVETFTASGALMNEYGQNAKPLVRAYGTGSFTINNTTMTISAADVYTDIDCEIQDAHKGVVNKNSYVSGSFPVLVPGSNGISMSGITKLEITPRWWRL